MSIGDAIAQRHQEYLNSLKPQVRRVEKEHNQNEREMMREELAKLRASMEPSKSKKKTFTIPDDPTDIVDMIIDDKPSVTNTRKAIAKLVQELEELAEDDLFN